MPEFVPGGPPAASNGSAREANGHEVPSDEGPRNDATLMWKPDSLGEDEIASYIATIRYGCCQNS